MPRRGIRKHLTKSLPSESPRESRPSVKRKQWTSEQMETAMKAVKSGGGNNRAAHNHGVPPSRQIEW